jgi:hypothetical protein
MTPTVSMPIERIQNTLQDLVVEKTVRNEEIYRPKHSQKSNVKIL